MLSNNKFPRDIIHKTKAMRLYTALNGRRFVLMDGFGEQIWLQTNFYNIGKFVYEYYKSKLRYNGRQEFDEVDYKPIWDSAWCKSDYNEIGTFTYLMNGMKSYFSLRAYANGLFGAVRLDDNCVFFLTPDEHLARKVFEYINKYYQAEINATDIAFCGLDRISINEYIRIRLKCILEVREITMKHISNVSGFQYSSLIRFLDDRQYDSRVEALYKVLEALNMTYLEFFSTDWFRKHVEINNDIYDTWEKVATIKWEEEEEEGPFGDVEHPRKEN